LTATTKRQFIYTIIDADDVILTFIDYEIYQAIIGMVETTTTRTTTVLWSFVQDYPGEPVPEETLTHPPS